MRQSGGRVEANDLAVEHRVLVEVVDRGDVLSHALQLGGELAALPRVAVAAAKRAVRASSARRGRP